MAYAAMLRSQALDIPYKIRDAVGSRSFILTPATMRSFLVLVGVDAWQVSGSFFCCVFETISVMF